MLGVGAAGFGLALVGVATGAWPLLVPVALLLGVGYGLCLAAGLTMVGELAAPTARGALMRGALMRGFFGRPRRPGHPLAVGIGAHSSRAKPTVMGSEQVCNQTFRPDEEGLCGGAIHRSIFSRDISFWRKFMLGSTQGAGCDQRAWCVLAQGTWFSFGAAVALKACVNSVSVKFVKGDPGLQEQKVTD